MLENTVQFLDKARIAKIDEPDAVEGLAVYNRRKIDIGTGLIAGAHGFQYVSPWINILSENPIMIIPAGVTVVAAIGANCLASEWYYRFREKDNSSFSYRYFKYRGAEVDLNDGNVLKPNQYFYRVNFSGFGEFNESVDKSKILKAFDDPNNVRAAKRLMQSGEDGIKVFAAQNMEHDIAAIELQGVYPAEIIEKFDKYKKVTRKDLYANKDYVIKDPESVVYLLSAQELDDLDLTDKSLFDKAKEVLDHPFLAQYFDLAAQAKTEQEQQKVKLEIERILRGMLTADLMTKYSNPELIATNKNGRYQKTRINPVVTVTTKPHLGLCLQQVIAETGQVKVIPLDKLYETEGVDIDQIIEQAGSDLKAKLAFYIYDQLQKKSLNDLVSEDNLTSWDARDKLHISGIHYQGEKRYIADSLDEKKTKRAQILNMRQRILPFAFLTGVNILAATGLGMLLNPDKSVEAVKSIVPYSEESKQSKPGVSIDIPASAPDWLIRSYATRESGYYTTATSHFINGSGAWELNTEEDKKIELPKEVSPETPRLELEKFIMISPLRSTSIKLPMRDGTDVAALKVIDPNGKEVAVEITKLTDGTVRVDIPAQTVSVVRIIHSLTETEDGGVTAVGSVNAPDLAKVSDETKQKIAKMQANGTGTTEVSNAVKNEYTYSITTHPEFDINKAKDHEHFMDLMTMNESCDCDVCATYALSIAALDPNNKVNFAEGYLHNVNNVASGRKPYIDQASRHGYGIDDKGKIIDATPPGVTNDQPTQESIQSLGNSSTEQVVNPSIVKEPTLVVPENKTFESELKVKQHKDTILNGLGFVAGITTLGMGYLVGCKVWKWGSVKIQNRDKEEDKEADIAEISPDDSEQEITVKKTNLFQQIKEKILPKAEPINMQLAKEFLSWVSYGESVQFGFDQLKSTTPKSIAEISKVTAYNQLKKYLEDPESFEQKAGISSAESKSMRVAAKEIIRIQSR